VTEVTESIAQSLQDAARLLRGAQRLLVVSHVNPDADAIGSTLGLTLGLRAMGKQVVVALNDRVPDYARFLPCSEDIVSSLPPDSFDVFIFADSADIDRVGSLYLEDPDRFRSAPILNLDHHRTNPGFGAVNLVDPAASSTSELSYRLLSELGAPIGVDAATDLLFGIIGDTGSFQNGATTPGSLQVAAELLKLGADNQRIAFQLFERKTFAAARLWGHIVSTIELERERRIVFAWLSQDMMLQAGVMPDETEGIVEYLRGIIEAEVVMLLKETEEGAVRVSMRSRPGIDVSAIASLLDGGGHRQAAGCTLPGPYERAKADLVAAFDRLYPR
jgi:bifunctional oligoribonuclease and PAP phosphatase NrnA